MLRFTENEPLVNRHTFKVQASSSFFVETDQPGELFDFLAKPNILNTPSTIIGEGSNILFKDDYKGLLIHPIIKGVTIVKENPHEVTIEAQAGVNWDELVSWTVRRGYAGLENLSMIPGSVGSAAVQNIGAYGAEAGEWISEVLALDLETTTSVWLSKKDCAFKYRNSIFKSHEGSKLLVWSVRFCLQKNAQINIQHEGLKEQLQQIAKPGVKDLRKAVIELRSGKLPDIKDLGNAGSFFKNPVVPKSLMLSLKNKYQDIPVYPAEVAGKEKLAAAWLIEKCGFKGYRLGDAGVYPKQALVLVNYGKATGNQILSLAEKITEAVYIKFGIRLSPEVKVI